MKIDGIAWVMEFCIKDHWYPWDSSFVLYEEESLREEFEKWGRRSPDVPRRIKAYVRHEPGPATLTRESVRSDEAVVVTLYQKEDYWT